MSTTWLAPEPEFVYRPLQVREPFGHTRAQRYPLEAVARDIGAGLIVDAFDRLDGQCSVVCTDWLLPMYELALMTAGGAHEMGIELSVTIVTPEDAPLDLFAPAASRAVIALLQSRGITAIVRDRGGGAEPGVVSIQPGHRTLRADRVIALPQLSSP